MGWTEGYVAGIDYFPGYYREMAPAVQALALVGRGLRPTAAEGAFRYLELGCGYGFSAGLIAAANPRAEVWGVDFNPAHIAEGRRLAEAAGLRNLRLIEASFAEFKAMDAPDFDMVALHGVYSWVSPENRRILVELLRRRLKPGGVAYVSYNALPGQAAEAPLARLIRDHAMAEPGPIPARLDRALAFAGRLRQAGAAYFAMAPAAGPHLDGLQGQTRNYLAHEYLNSHRTAFYHADIAAELAEAKLDFAASALLLGQFDNLNLSPEQQALLAEVGDPARRETLRDFILGQGFRRDLFQRGLRPLAPAEAAARLRATRFALVTPRRQMPRTAACPRGQIAFAPAVYDPLLDALAEGPQPLAALEARTGLPWEPLREAILLLCAAGHAEPAVAEAEADSARDSTARFNAAVLEENGKGVELMALASPVLGTGVAVDRADRLFLAALQRGADPLAFARAALPPPPSDNPADDPLPRRFEIFETLHLPILRQLGVA